MNSEGIELTEAEWEVMEFLWANPGSIGRDITESMAEKKGWSRSTTLTLLTRLENKGAVAGSAEGKKRFTPLVSREDAALRETKNLLDRVYNGSVGMLVTAFTKKQRLTQAEIDEMYAILHKLEVKDDD